MDTFLPAALVEPTKEIWIHLQEMYNLIGKRDLEPSDVEKYKYEAEEFRKKIVASQARGGGYVCYVSLPSHRIAVLVGAT
jgi:hypothetical protein